jgi:uracil-DNA glycosylase family protein
MEWAPAIKDARPFLPVKGEASIATLARAVQKCRGCELYKNATQAVFGEGGEHARLIFIGEQPGDQEDLQGHPFVGPAGKMLDRALEEVGLDRGETYVTNAVKHFKWTPAPRGKRRIHSKPSAREVKACNPWLVREISRIKPEVIVTLGATAGQSLFGAKFRLGEMRGKIIRDTQWAPAVVCTVHPSAILRIPDREERHREYAGFVRDLKMAHGVTGGK